jgi:hypothetical protein
VNLRPQIAAAATLIVLALAGCASATETFSQPLHPTIDSSASTPPRMSVPARRRSAVRRRRRPRCASSPPTGRPSSCAPTQSDSRDRYGRILAHAFVKGRQLELAQLRRGWAYVYRYRGQSFDGLPAFAAAERHARHGHLGVWGLCHGDFHSAESGLQN